MRKSSRKNDLVISIVFCNNIISNNFCFNFIVLGFVLAFPDICCVIPHNFYSRARCKLPNTAKFLSEQRATRANPQIKKITTMNRSTKLPINLKSSSMFYRTDCLEPLHP